MGRTYKDIYRLTKDKKYIKKAAEAYYTGYLHSNEYYPAINAASLFLLLEDNDKASKLASEIIKQIADATDYWATVTLGEAWLILGEVEKAKYYYQSAVIAFQKQFGKFRSTSNQLEFLQEGIDIPDELLEIFPRPNLAVFSGHMIDAPGRETKRFPPDIETEVKEALDKMVDDLDIDIGFTSLASGGDILFAEVLLERNAEIKAYLPFRKEDFISTSIAPAGSDWLERFEDSCHVKPKFLTQEPYLETPDLFNHLGNVMMGECMLLAEQYAVTPFFISVLAPSQANKTGGTQELSNIWPFVDTHHNIDPTQYISIGTRGNEATQTIVSEKEDHDQVDRRMGNILFADIVGSSKLLREDTPEIILEIFSEMNKIIAPYKNEMFVVNTWGDAIILCHSDTNAIIEIACAVQELFMDKKSKKLGLPKGINVRIALHKGPVFLAEDPLTNEPNVYGTSINRTARMEPVTLPGSIYASDQFAATLKLDTGDQFQYQHTGVIELPKGFGKQEVYRITRNMDASGS